MWLQSWRSQYFKFVVVLGTCLFSQRAIAETAIIESLEDIKNISEIRLNTAIEESKKDPRLFTELANATQIDLDPDFVSQLLFNSGRSIISLIKQNECNFYALLENGSLSSNLTKRDLVLVNFKDSKGEIKKATISKDDYFEYLYQKKCFTNKDIKNLFRPQNFPKTLKGILFTIPKGKKSCDKIHNNWLLNPYTPYLCYINSLIQSVPSLKSRQESESKNSQVYSYLSAQISLANKFRYETSAFQESYMNSLCDNLNQKDNFCQKFLTKNYWTRILNNERPLAQLYYRCQEMLKQDDLKPSDLKLCESRIARNDQICQYLGARFYPSLTPKPRCKTLSRSLALTKMNANYQDCPGLVDNEGVVNIARIMGHFDNDKAKASREFCYVQSTERFLALNDEYGSPNSWGVKICFDDKVLGEYVCKPTVLGMHPDSPFSEDKIVADILKRRRSAEKDLQCTVIESDEYNPQLLEYKDGCFIVYESQYCNSYNCPKTIWFRGREIKFIEYKGKPFFDYFPNSFDRIAYAQNKNIDKKYRLKGHTIKNLTELKAFFMSSTNSLIHGQGCIEDLLPTFFQKKFFNQCTPAPFIIESFLEEKTGPKLIVRLSVDDIQTPRILKWNYVYSAITNYIEFQPTKTWTLYGIKK